MCGSVVAEQHCALTRLSVPSLSHLSHSSQRTALSNNQATRWGALTGDCCSSHALIRRCQLWHCPLAPSRAQSRRSPPDPLDRQETRGTSRSPATILSTAAQKPGTNAFWSSTSSSTSLFRRFSATSNKGVCGSVSPIRIRSSTSRIDVSRICRRACVKSFQGSSGEARMLVVSGTGVRSRSAVLRTDDTSE